MDLLENNKKNKTKSKSQKIVLGLLIFSVVLSIIIFMALLLIQSQGGNSLRNIEINGTKNTITDLGIIQTEDGTEYISLKTICNKLNYEYKKGEFNIPGEDTDKGYIDNGQDIIQFYANSTKIFKTKEESKLDYQYFNLEKNVLINNDELYIAISDLKNSLNLIVFNLEANNSIIIQTPEYWIEKNTATLEERNLKISEDVENNKALSFNYVIVENNSKFGVIDLTGKEVIGTKYNSINFCEYTRNFIASNSDDKYGIINEDGTAKVQLQFDSLEIINYNPLLYKVEKLGSFGIMRENGAIVNEISYESIGYPENVEKGISNTLIIPQLNENIPTSIVVCKDSKYGLIELETGKLFLQCNLKGIFLVVDKENDFKKYYVAEMEDGSINTLEKYYNNVNQITANINS